MKTLAWVVFGASVIVGVASSVLAWLNRDVPVPATLTLGSRVLDVIYPVAFLVMPAVGLLIASRAPRHLIAWSFLVLGSAEVDFALQNYGLHGVLVAPGSLPYAGVALWMSTWVWVLPIGVLALILLVFPDGRPVSPRWWWVAWVAAAAAVAQGVADAVRQPATSSVPLESPLGPPPDPGLLEIVSVVGSVTWAFATLAAAASLVLRSRRARGDARQQIKWFAFASGIVGVMVVVSTFVYADPTFGPLASGAAALSLLLIPAAAAVAILRYRLYDIDVVIERTLVYGSLTAVIAATYVAFVVLLQAALRPITGGSEIAVAGSTLATLALIQPFRRRIQDAVDRRFYRSRYDAARTLDTLTSRLRDEVDLDAVRVDLLGAIDETVRPTHARVWLRERS